MIFGVLGWYRSGFCGVWVEWNYYVYPAQHFSTLKCKHIPVLFQAVFQCVFCNKNEHWPRDKLLTVTRIPKSSRKWYKCFVFAVWWYLNRCICSKYKCISMTYSYSFVYVISFWYHFDIKKYLTLITNFNTFNNYSTTFSTICWKAEITLLNIKV